MNTLFYFSYATGVYTQYLENQYDTFQYLFPNIENKHIIMMTNDVSLSEKSTDKIHFVWVPQIHYNISCLMKYQYATEVLKMMNIEYDLENDFYLFCDADTYFLDRPLEIWEYWTNIMKTTDLVCNNYAQFPSETRGYTMCYEYAERNPKFCGYYKITTDSVNICSNIIMGRLGGLFKIAENIIKMTDKDINIDVYNRHFPVINEETYVNAMVNNYLQGVKMEDLHDITCHVGFLHAVPYCEEYYFYNDPNVGNFENQMKLHPEIICMSKYNNSFKRKTPINLTPYYGDIDYKVLADHIYLLIGDENISQEKIGERFYRISLGDEYQTILRLPISNDNYTMQHYYALKDALCREYESIMIIDYDCKLPANVNWPKMCISQLNEQPKKDIQSLSGALSNLCSTKWYIINRQGMQKIVNSIESGETIQGALTIELLNGNVNVPYTCGALDKDFLNDSDYMSTVEYFEMFECDE